MRSYIKEKMLNFAFQNGIMRIGHRLFANSLTVLNYHRIDDIYRSNFDSFKPNVSANLDNFDAQLSYISRWFNVISINEFVQWLDGKKSLPPHAMLITFDDGYRDNYTNAFPILRKYNLPAVIFLTTGHIERDIPFYWDLIAFCFHYTNHNTISFPDNRQVHWENKREASKVSLDIIESLKRMPEERKRLWLEHLPEKLNVSVPKNYFRNLMMTWDQVREMRTGNIDFGGHTIHHPILTRVSLKQAKEEIVGSKLRIEQELNETILGFAYPNGGKVDFNQDIKSLTADAGYRVAFSLLHGPTSHSEVKKNPFSIRRIFISHHHSLPMFSALLSGLNRYRP